MPSSSPRTRLRRHWVSILGALALGERFGRQQIGEEFGGEALVSGEIFSGQHDDAGGQAVTQRVQADFCFPISLRGPVLCWALRRLASIWTTFRVDDMDRSPGFEVQHGVWVNPVVLVGMLLKLIG